MYCPSSFTVSDVRDTQPIKTDHVDSSCFTSASKTNPHSYSVFLKHAVWLPTIFSYTFVHVFMDSLSPKKTGRPFKPPFMDFICILPTSGLPIPNKEDCANLLSLGCKTCTHTLATASIVDCELSQQLIFSLSRLYRMSSLLFFYVIAILAVTNTFCT